MEFPQLDSTLSLAEDLQGRLFLSNITSSSSVSATYATFIVLAISFGLAAIGALIYYGLLAMTSGGSSSSSGYGTRKGQYGYYKRSADGVGVKDEVEDVEHVEHVAWMMKLI